MSSLALDASVVIASVLEEHNAAKADAVLDRVRADGAVVPAHWHLEIGNALLIVQRRGNLEPAQRARVIRALGKLKIEVDVETQHRAWRATIDLAARHRLTLYDAAHLELSVRRGLPLASFDTDLRRAATAESVSLV